ncbi:IS3 family transposase ISRhosp5 [Rhodococcus sp. T7]|nr:IS3 family transposase ISRhosp5 [Rhodococcus sp. T7]KAF0959016.1 IS3 family transposase ISRhosp5 [Rhodococcus sp. T7]
MSRFHFVDDHRDTVPVKWLCQILEVSRSGFYRWRSAAPARAERARADEELAERIRVIHADSDGTYGAPRVTAELRGAGIEVNHKGRTGDARARDRRRAPAQDGPHHRPGPGRGRGAGSDPAGLHREHAEHQVRRGHSPKHFVQGGTPTYVPVGDNQFLYLATILDLCSKRFAG